MAIVGSFKIESHKKDVEDELKSKVNDWLEAIGLDAASTSASKAPVDTGRLKNSITYAVDNAGFVVYIGTNVEYAAAQEFGDYKHKVGQSHYLQYGCTEHLDQYKAMLEQKLK